MMLLLLHPADNLQQKQHLGMDKTCLDILNPIGQKERGKKAMAECAKYCLHHSTFSTTFLTSNHSDCKRDYI